MSVKQAIKNAIKYPVEQMAARFGTHRRPAREPMLWVLMYHRILPREDGRYSLEEPGMIVEPETLRMHMQVVKELFTPIALEEWIDRYNANKPLPEKACAVTFDDGWLDNYEYGFPILEEEEIPATLFVVSSMVGTDKEFWPNRLIRLLRVPVEQRGDMDWLVQKHLGQMGPDELSGVIFSMKSYPDEEIMEILDEAEENLGIEPSRKPVLMNWDQVADLANHDLFNIGSHTRRHVRVDARLDDAVMLDEITGSKMEIEENIGAKVDLFCYPKGANCEKSRKIVAEHYKGAVVTEYGINNIKSIQLDGINRVGIHQDSSPSRVKFESKLSGLYIWMRG